MLQHLTHDLLHFLKQKCLEGEIVLGVFRLGSEGSDVLLRISQLDVLWSPIHDENGLEERIGRFRHPRDIASHEGLDADLNDVC